MKSLFLLRHAKSSWNDSSLPDFERPLNMRGRNGTELIGTFIKKNEVSPDLILSSPAARARETIELVMKSANMKADLRYDQRIYDASAHVLSEVVSQIEDDKSSVLLVGHNPGMESLLHLLTGRTESFATATLAKIDLDVSSWSHAVGTQGTLDWIVKPKELEES